MALRQCDWCGSQVPDSRFCIRCGNELNPEKQTGALSRFGQSVSGIRGLSGVSRSLSGVFSLPGAGEPPSSLSGVRRAFAAAPGESVLQPSIVSTVFPQLPQSSMAVFRICLGLGSATILVLGLAKLYPVALMMAAILLPLLAIVYFYDVNVFETQPFTIVGATLAWGAATGAATALIAKGLSPTGTQVFVESTRHAVWSRGVVVPLVSFVLMLAGPLYMLRFPRFSTVLDGALFGSASAVAFTGAEVIVQGLSAFGDGLRPLGAVAPWLVKLATIGLALPVMTMAVVAACAGAVWLKYRASIRDRSALGRLGNPLLAALLAAGALVAASVVQIVLPIGVALAVITVLALVALLWLRCVIHVGLLEEALEIEDAPIVTCANCGHRTRLGKFCENCGVSLAALPASRSSIRRAPSSLAGGPGG